MNEIIHNAENLLEVKDLKKYFPIKLRKFNIHPEGIFRSCIKICTILHNPGIHRILETVGKSGLIKQFILVFGKFNFEISFWP